MCGGRIMRATDAAVAQITTRRHHRRLRLRHPDTWLDNAPLASSRAAGALPTASAARFEAVDESATMSTRIALLPGLLAATMIAAAVFAVPAASAAPVATIVEG